MINKKLTFIGMIVFALVLTMLGFASAASVCCEKTDDGLYCQNVPAEQCTNANSVQTSCQATSFCKPGTCYDTTEGTCLDNTPKLVCNMNGGVWSDGAVPQCNLGCCLLGDQAAFVTLVRCKKLASFLGLEINYKKDIKNEVQCISSVLGQVKGACVYESEFERTCRITTKDDCLGVSGGRTTNQTKNEFFSGKLCSAEELKTICGPTTKTICVPGKEEVYFVDSCGNPANIYDASKATDKEYWTNIKDKTESCNAGAANAKSASCGNCNYIAGTFCRKTTSGTAKATYGSNICADLNCYKTQNGKNYKHGESWCVYNDKGSTGKGNDAVGSQFYRHICINGEEVLEACADFRQYECIGGSIDTTAGPFAQAGCRVNRWQDCTKQTEQDECQNTDKRDCRWVNIPDGLKCVPKNPPGLKFWEGTEAKNICAKANLECTATLETDLFGNEDWSGDCVDGSGDLVDGWELTAVEACKAIGDCGPKINWVGDIGYKGAYQIDFDGDIMKPTSARITELAKKDLTVSVKTEEEENEESFLNRIGNRF